MRRKEGCREYRGRWRRRRRWRWRRSTGCNVNEGVLLAAACHEETVV